MHNSNSQLRCSIESSPRGVLETDIFHALSGRTVSNVFPKAGSSPFFRRQSRLKYYQYSTVTFAHTHIYIYIYTYSLTRGPREQTKSSCQLPSLALCSGCWPLVGDRDEIIATIVVDRRQGKGATLLPMHPDSSRGYACKDYTVNTSFHRMSRFDAACNRSLGLQKKN